MESEKNGLKKHLPKILVAVALVGALFIGAIALGPSLAQAQEGSPVQPAEGAFGRPGKGGFQPGQGLFKGAEYNTYLAEALGITVDELQAAFQQANEAALADAVEQGKVTEEQAEMIRAHWALKDYINPEELFAQALGISVEELQAAREDGKTVKDLIDDLGIDPESFKEALREAWEAAVMQAAEDGVITEAQAEQIISSGFHMPRFGGRGGRPGFPGGRGPKPPQAPGDNG